jgi:hypothetical protein
MPTARAAAGSSRVARSLRPKRLRWYANAATMTASAPRAAWRRSVVSGTDENVFRPGPTFS